MNNCEKLRLDAKIDETLLETVTGGLDADPKGNDRNFILEGANGSGDVGPEKALEQPTITGAVPPLF